MVAVVVVTAAAAVVVVVVENADATPPHLNVFLHLGCSGDLLGSLKFVCIDLAKHPNNDWKIWRIISLC